MPAVVLIETSAGRGSGFFVAPDTIVTNAHVVGRDSSVSIRRANGETTTARVESVAQELDLAVLKTTGSAAQATLALGSSASARPGQEVVAIGSPLGVFQNTVTRGIVSSVRTMGDVTLLQTDAAINPGNSGGPLLDRAGAVIGITTMGVRSSQGLSFAVASDHARALLNGTRALPTSNATPLASLNSSLQSTGNGGPSDADALRQKGEAAYTQALAQLAQRADQLDDYWRRFKTSCYTGKIAGSFEREWLALSSPSAMPGAVSPGCTASFTDVKRTATDIRQQVLGAEETARRAGVFPGVLREGRRRYRLEGFDR
jgi:V8-like Glu-specific endopeptidase